MSVFTKIYRIRAGHGEFTAKFFPSDDDDFFYAKLQDDGSPIREWVSWEGFDGIYQDIKYLNAVNVHLLDGLYPDSIPGLCAI